ncbi:hypothetical protein CVU37_01725 [candidate division BRC1 bacterium HGW-BRC1-1]|jgi:phosphohistidine phosphatase|nr:MAG: hypothetical protein CVU37_01725 [candidate division BRC1 bacterium HGW-BRC1-1]
MKIIFIRHALAEELGHGKPGLDELRRIVKPGATQTRHLALALARLRLRPDILLTSPLVRARETADVIMENMKRCPEPLETDALTPEGSWADLRHEIARHGVQLAGRKGDKEAVLFAVGHQPNLSQMIMAALGSDPHEIRMKKSACVGLSWNDDKPQGMAGIFLALDPALAKILVKTSAAGK